MPNVTQMDFIALCSTLPIAETSFFQEPWVSDLTESFRCFFSKTQREPFPLRFLSTCSSIFLNRGTMTGHLSILISQLVLSQSSLRQCSVGQSGSGISPDVASLLLKDTKSLCLG